MLAFPFLLYAAVGGRQMLSLEFAFFHVASIVLLAARLTIQEILLSTAD
jgi:hypothetical protein